MVDYTNKGQITNLLAANTGAGLIDYTDVIHSGLIKVLHRMNQGNYVLEYGNFTQSDGGSFTGFAFNGGTTTVQYLRDNKLVLYTANTVLLLTAPHATTNTNRYDLIVFNSAGALDKIVGTASATEPIVPNLRAGDIPVAMIEMVGGSANDASNRRVQMFPLDKDANSLSIAYDSSGYTETASIIGAAGVQLCRRSDYSY